jgi:hypothetical protein
MSRARLQLEEAVPPMIRPSLNLGAFAIELGSAIAPRLPSPYIAIRRMPTLLRFGSPSYDLLHAIQGSPPRHPHKALRSRAFQRTKKASAWWLVRVRSAELLRGCCAESGRRRAQRLGQGYHCGKQMV